MANPHTVGTVFWHTISYPDGLLIPLVNRTTTTEVEPPFRTGKCHIFKVPFTNRGVVVGRWNMRLSESAAWHHALGFRVLEDNGIKLEDDLV